MRRQFFPALGNGSFHRIAYTDWGQAANPQIVMCVHGLARNSRDFDHLAAALAPDCRVVCMDVAGRGESDWLENKSEYTFATYQRDAAAMLARYRAGGPPLVRAAEAVGAGASRLGRYLHGRVDRHVPRREEEFADPAACTE